jgi:hypothetical protein
MCVFQNHRVYELCSQVRKPEILSLIRHRQNPLDCTCMGLPTGQLNKDAVQFAMSVLKVQVIVVS